MLEPYVLKGTCTVLRGERGGNTPDLPDLTPYGGVGIEIAYGWGAHTDHALLLLHYGVAIHPIS